MSTFHITYGAIKLITNLPKLGATKFKAIRLSDNKPVIIDISLTSTTNCFLG